MSLGIDFSTLAGVAAVNVFITEAIVKGCNVQKDWLKQLISWITPVVLCVVGLLCQLGLFSEYGTIGEWQSWVYTLVTGIGLGLTSNGLFDLPFVKQFLEWLVKLLSKKKEANIAAYSLPAYKQDAECPVEPVGDVTETCVSENETEAKSTPKVMVESGCAAPFENSIQEAKKTPKRVRKTKTQKSTKNND